MARAVAPIPLTGTGTPVASNVAAIDTFGYNSALINIMVGTVTGTTAAVTYTIDAKVQESATSGGTYTDISGATITQIVGSHASTPVIAQIRVELGTPRQRFLKVVITPSITPTLNAQVVVAATAVLGRAFKAPTGNSSTASFA